MLPLETFHSHHKRERALRRMVSPQDRTARICISLATSDPLPDHRSSTQTFSGLQIIFTLPESCVQSKWFKKHMEGFMFLDWLVSYSQINRFFQIPPHPHSITCTLSIKQAITAFPTGLLFHRPTWTEPCTSATLTFERMLFLVTITFFVSSCN